MGHWQDIPGTNATAYHPDTDADQSIMDILDQATYWIVQAHAMLTEWREGLAAGCDPTDPAIAPLLERIDDVLASADLPVDDVCPCGDEPNASGWCEECETEIRAGGAA